MRVSTTLALQVRFPTLHRKEIIFFDGRPRVLSNARENIFATQHGLPRGGGSKDDWPPAFLNARSGTFAVQAKNFHKQESLT